jgi:hypothetical protein
VQPYVYVPFIIFCVTQFLRLLCGLMALWFARNDPRRNEQLFKVFLELFRHGWFRPRRFSIRGLGVAGRRLAERLALRPQTHVRPDDDLNTLFKGDEA